MNRYSFLLFSVILLLNGCLAPSSTLAPVTAYGATKGEGSGGVHTVHEGETLWTISQRYNMALRDIAVLNRLSPPFALTPGQRLRLPPPLEYTVRKGDSLYEISRVFGVNTYDVAKQNNLSPPYNLVAGQKLRMPSPAPPEPPAVVARTQTQERAEPTPMFKAAPPQAKPTPAAKPPVKGTVQEAAPTPAPEVKPEPKTKVTAATPKRASSKFLKPVQGRVISGYGPKQGGLHNDGMNIAAQKGTPVIAAENGVVVYAGNELKGSGNLVLIRHDGRWMTAYAHLDRFLIKRGETVRRGQSIGTVGTTGSVSVPQLHFEVRRGTEAINPERYLEE